MSESPPVDRGPALDSRIRDHLANERTLLAWQRTALTILGFGFVVDRFALGGAGTTTVGSWLGIGLVLLGGVVSVVGASRYVTTEREIDRGIYHSSIGIHLILTAAIVGGAIALAIYLVR